MTLPQRIALIVKRGLALLHPCVYGELGSKDTTAEIAVELEKEVAMLMPGKDAKAIVAAFLARLSEVKRLVATDVQAAYEGDPAAACGSSAPSRRIQGSTTSLRHRRSRRRPELDLAQSAAYGRESGSTRGCL